MLSATMDQQLLMSLCHDDNWVMTVKLDGTRKLAEVRDGKAVLYNRHGEVTAAPGRHNFAASLASSFKKGHWILDGEMLRMADNTYRLFVFDLPVVGDVVTPETPFGERLLALDKVADLCNWGVGALVSTLVYERTTEEKLRLVKRLLGHRAEGVIARALDAPYEEGERSRSSLKFKFVRTADCIVVDKGRKGRRNLTLAVYRDGRQVEVGECTALAGDGSAAEIGDVVQVNYLSVSDKGRLVQPTKPILRIDKFPEDCNFDQLVPLSREVFE